MKVSKIFSNKLDLFIYLSVVVFTALLVTLQLNVKNASALSPSDFKPGRIIDDAVFYNNNSMTAQQIQNFLNDKMPFCDTNGTQSVSYYYNPNTKYVSYGTYQSGASWVTTTRAVFGERTYQYRMSLGLPDNGSRTPYKCLKNYTMNVPQQPAASGLCSEINAMSNATAAQIIKTVADACGVNPQVILVILEKEQSLVQGDNWPFGTRWSHAMGFACPDTAACDVNYEGLFKQIYHGAKQYKIYKRSPQNYNYQPGQNNIVLYNPDSRCGSSTIFIENQATAGLYNYTPYQPNQASINWKLGSGGAVSSYYPGCGAFGNLNFFMLFSNWFGNPTYKFPVRGGIAIKYQSLGANQGYLGYPASNAVALESGGVYQQFDNGRIYWKAGVGSWPVRGGIGNKYEELGADASPLGYPVSEAKALESGGAYQQFENGKIYWKAGIGAWGVQGGIASTYEHLGGTEGSLGYPAGNATALESGGAYQQFENGKIYWKAGIGAWGVQGGIASKYEELDADNGPLGYPTGEAVEILKGLAQQKFEKGFIQWSISRGAVETIY